MKMAKNVTTTGLVKRQDASTVDSSRPPEKSLDKDIALRAAKDLSVPKAVSPAPYTRPVPATTLQRPSPKLIQPVSRVPAVKHVSKKPGRKNAIPTDLVRLNVKKRDLASVEEIHEEMRRKKGLLSSGDRPSDSKPKLSPASIPRPVASSAKRPAEDRARGLPSSEASKSHGQGRPIPGGRAKEADRSAARPRVDQSPLPKKKKNDYSSVIQSIFGYNRNRYRDMDSDDSSDMEANYRDVEREEKRALKLAKREDLEEELRGAR
ncbi:hypothetical protein HDU91_000184 [Kappamyces sp. JEL0680]|nr:hypothetical protein HDU91_000184 [Kappamyces sp. JEL0680]